MPLSALTATSPWRDRAAAFTLLVALLGTISFFASRQRMPDSYWYTNTAERTIVPGCAEIHCYRVLVPWIVGVLPGTTFLKWRAYSVVVNALAAIAVSDLALAFGLSRRAATIAMFTSALGFGAQFTIYDPFNADPLMFFLSPLVTRWLLERRWRASAAVACVAVLAKEFVVAPIVIFGLASARAADWLTARRAFAIAGAAFAIWVGVQAFLTMHFGYSYGGNPSTHLASGGYLWFWLTHESVRQSVFAQFAEFGALYLLAPVGWRRAPVVLKALTIAAVPVACVFAYVQQPDRALWNFHFLVSPLAALALEPAGAALTALFLTTFGLANLRIGSQVEFLPQARFPLVISLAIAVATVTLNVRQQRARRLAG